MNILKLWDEASQTWVSVPAIRGLTGPGVPAGGTTGQYLRKTSAADYAAEWANLPTIEDLGIHVVSSAPTSSDSDGLYFVIPSNE